jgi:Spy/CpxP family protein refolding chaperone
MMNRYAALVVSAILFGGAVMITATPVHSRLAQDGPPPQAPSEPGGPPPFGPPIERMARDLNLTDEQLSQVKAIFDAQRTVTQPLMKQMGEYRKQLDAATANGQFNEEQVRAIAQQQAQTTAQLTVENERTKAKIYNILTPEQRELAKQLPHRHLGPRRGPHPGGEGSASN